MNGNEYWEDLRENGLLLGPGYKRDIFPNYNKKKKAEYIYMCVCLCVYTYTCRCDDCVIWFHIQCLQIFVLSKMKDYLLRKRQLGLVDMLGEKQEKGYPGTLSWKDHVVKSLGSIVVKLKINDHEIMESQIYLVKCLPSWSEGLIRLVNLGVEFCKPTLWEVSGARTSKICIREWLTWWIRI